MDCLVLNARAPKRNVKAGAKIMLFITTQKREP